MKKIDTTSGQEKKSENELHNKINEHVKGSHGGLNIRTMGTKLRF